MSKCKGLQEFINHSKPLLSHRIKQAALCFDEIHIMSHMRIPKEGIFGYEASRLLGWFLGEKTFSKDPAWLKFINRPGSNDSFLGIAGTAASASEIDYRNRQMIIPGCSEALVKGVLFDFNMTFYEAWHYIRHSSSKNPSMIMHPWFDRFLLAKSKYFDRSLPSFDYSPSIEFLFPNINVIPWDEINDLRKESTSKFFRESLKSWDESVANNEKQISKERAILEAAKAYTDFLESSYKKAVTSPLKAWISFVAGLIPYVGSVAGVVPIVEAYRQNRIWIGMVSSYRRKWSSMETTKK